MMRDNAVVADFLHNYTFFLEALKEMADDRSNDKALRAQATPYLAEISNPLLLLDVYSLPQEVLSGFQKQNTLVNHQVHTLEAFHQSLNLCPPPYVQEEFQPFMT